MAGEHVTRSSMAPGFIEASAPGWGRLHAERLREQRQDDEERLAEISSVARIGGAALFPEMSQPAAATTDEVMSELEHSRILDTPDSHGPLPEGARGRQISDAEAKGGLL